MKKHVIEAANVLRIFTKRYDGRRCGNVTVKTERYDMKSPKTGRWFKAVAAVRGTEETCPGTMRVTKKTRLYWKGGWVPNGVGNMCYRSTEHEEIRIEATCEFCDKTHVSKWFNEHEER